MRYCKKCLYPDTKPQIIFNDEGICSACVNHDKKEIIDWDKKRQEFQEILHKYKSRNKTNYDCIIPVSGGKDSHYQTYVCLLYTSPSPRDQRGYRKPAYA